MLYKTDRDREELIRAHRGGFVGKDNEAFVDGQLLCEIAGIWRPAERARFAEFLSAVPDGEVFWDRYLAWIERCRTT